MVDPVWGLPKNICANFHAFTRFCTPQTTRSIAFKFLCLTLHVTYLQKGAITPLFFVQICCNVTYFIKIRYEMTFWLKNSYTFSIFENIHCQLLKKVKIQNFSKFSKIFKNSNFYCTVLKVWILTKNWLSYFFCSLTYIEILIFSVLLYNH